MSFSREVGGYLDGSALRRRYTAALSRAGLRRLRFHEYADVCVMPMSSRRGCSQRFLGLRGRHNHDLRHRFAVQTLIDWERSNVNIDEHITTLSTYLGHVSPADTYWYLSASPELMALAAERVHDRFGGVR